MKKQHVEIIALVVLMLALIIAAVMALKPAGTPPPGAKANPSSSTETNAAQGQTDTSWVTPVQVAQAIPTTIGGRDPFKDLMLPAEPGPRPPAERNPPPIPVNKDHFGTLPGPGDMKPVDPPNLIVKGIVFSASQRYVAVVVDAKPYTLYSGENIPGTDWKVAEITPVAITVKNGTLTARFRLSGGS